MTVAALVSAFKCANFIERRIVNLIHQDPAPEVWAVCLVGSAEEAVCRAYGVHVIQLAETPTVYGAWNAIIEATSADYLVTANSDDFFYDFALAKMADVLDNHPEVSVVYPDADIAKGYDGPIIGRFEMPEFEPELLHELCFMGPMPMWRRRLHVKYGFFDSQLLVAGDYEFWLRVAQAGEEFRHLPQALGVYADRPESREHREPIRTLWETAQVRSKYTKEAYGPNSSKTASDHANDVLSPAQTTYLRNYPA